MITKLFGRIYVIKFFFCSFNKIIRVKIKKLILNKKKGILTFIKSYFEARIRKKKTL